MIIYDYRSNQSVLQPFNREPDFGLTSVNYDFAKLLARSGAPS